MTVGFNFLEAPKLPAPQVSDAQAEDILATHYGLRARATSLGSQQDKNFVVTVDGEIVGVLKIANPAFNATEIEADLAGYIRAIEACLLRDEPVVELPTVESPPLIAPDPFDIPSFLDRGTTALQSA